MLERNPLLVSLDLSACRSEAPWRSSWTAAISEDAQGADGEDAREACVDVGDGSFLKESAVSRSGGEEGGGGDISVSVSPLTKPGMMASGSVTFSDGVTCDWYLDQFGRPGLVPPAEGYRPPDADMPIFGKKLQEALQGGY